MGSDWRSDAQPPREKDWKSEALTEKIVSLGRAEELRTTRAAMAALVKEARRTGDFLERIKISRYEARSHSEAELGQFVDKPLEAALAAAEAIPKENPDG